MERPETYKLAEYHNLYLEGESRGLDAGFIDKFLRENGFYNIEVDFHTGARRFKDLPLSLKVRFLFLKFQNYSMNSFMENVSLLARKK